MRSGTQRAKHLPEWFGFFSPNVDQIFCSFRETARVRHQVAQRDRLSVLRRNFEVEIVVDVGVEIQLSRLRRAA